MTVIFIVSSVEAYWPGKPQFWDPRAMSCKAQSTLMFVFAASARTCSTHTASNLQPHTSSLESWLQSVWQIVHVQSSVGCQSVGHWASESVSQLLDRSKQYKHILAYVMRKIRDDSSSSSSCSCSSHSHSHSSSKVKGYVKALNENSSLRQRHHLPYGITQCCPPPDTSERAPPWHQQVSWYSIYLPRRDGRLSWPKLPEYDAITTTLLSHPSVGRSIALLLGVVIAVLPATEEQMTFTSSQWFSCGLQCSAKLYDTPPDVECMPQWQWELISYWT